MLMNLKYIFENAILPASLGIRLTCELKANRYPTAAFKHSGSWFGCAMGRYVFGVCLWNVLGDSTLQMNSAGMSTRQGTVDQCGWNLRVFLRIMVIMWEVTASWVDLRGRRIGSDRKCSAGYGCDPFIQQTARHAPVTRGRWQISAHCGAEMSQVIILLD